jgi:hypothetical protein
MPTNIPYKDPNELFDRPLGMKQYKVALLIESLTSYHRNGVYNLIDHEQLVRIIRDSAKRG